MSSMFGITCLSLTIALFAWHMSRQRQIDPSSLETGTNGFNQDVGPFTGSMMLSFNGLFSSCSTLHLV